MLEVKGQHRSRFFMASVPDNIRASLGEYYAFERELVGGGMARVYLAWIW